MSSAAGGQTVLLILLGLAPFITIDVRPCICQGDIFFLLRSFESCSGAWPACACIAEATHLNKTKLDRSYPGFGSLVFALRGGFKLVQLVVLPIMKNDVVTIRL